MTIKAVFFDMDGTLLTDNRTISKSTIIAINALKKQGILVGLATGRDPQFLLPYMASLGLDVVIAYNGQYIFSRQEVLFEQALQQEELDVIIDFADIHQKDLSFGLARGVAGSGVMSFGTGSGLYWLVRLVPASLAGLITFLLNRVIRKLKPQKKIDFDFLKQEPVYQMMLLATEKETEKLSHLYDFLTFTRSSPYATDIISRGNSKFQGILRVGEKLGFDARQVMVFGDSNNDLEMLAGVEYSVAMSNGTRLAKKTASYVTDSNNRDGIFKALVHFDLLGEDYVSE